jgi:hypothetical protein
MKREIIAEFEYEIPELTDEEIRNFFEAEGIADVDPEEVRNYINTSLYKLYCETVKQEE